MQSLRDVVRSLKPAVDNKRSLKRECSDSTTFDIGQLSDFRYYHLASNQELQTDLESAVRGAIAEVIDLTDLRLRFEVIIDPDTTFAELKLIYTGA